jgi:hypothetical protein
MRLPDEHNQYWITALPDGGKAVVNVDFSFDRYDELQCAGACGGGPSFHCAEYDSSLPRSIGDVTMWRVENGGINRFFFAQLCDWASPEILFPNGEGTRELIAGAEFPLDDCCSIEIRPITYVWDDAARTYIAPPPPTFTPLVSSQSTELTLSAAIPNYTLSHGTFNQMRVEFANRNFHLALEMLDGGLESDTSDQQLETAFRYYRALVLETLNRPDEALLEYAAIYEANPESAWGILAHLHVNSRFDS